MEGFCNKHLSLHEQAWDIYKIKRLEYRKLQIELRTNQAVKASRRRVPISASIRTGKAHGTIGQYDKGAAQVQG